MEGKGTSGLVRSPSTTPILSPENWERILSNLSPQDLRTAINTCVEFSQLMGSKKNAAIFRKILPLVINYLPLETILEFRKISKDIYSVMDLISDHLGIGTKYTLTGHRRIAKFMSLMESRPFPEENPFIGGSVITHSLLGNTEEQTNRRVEAVRQIFARYGHHVQELEFSDFPITFGIFTSFVSLLAYLPNLKSIHIYGYFFNLDYEDLESLALPKLDKLEELDISDGVFAKSYSAHSFGLRFLVEYGCQLKTLSLGSYFFHDFGRFCSMSLDSIAPNLVRFEMDGWPTDVSILKKLAAVTMWKLKELHLSGRYSAEALSDLLAAVNNFANSLVSLKLNWNPEEPILAEHRWNVGELVLLPNLKWLSLLFVILKLDWVWDFLKYSCNQLDTIYLKATDESEIKNAEEIGLLGMYIRHLFCILPMLGKIMIVGGSTSKERIIIRKLGM